MKKLFTLAAIAVACAFAQKATAQTGSATLATNFMEQAKSASDSKLGDIAAQLTGKVTKLESLLGTNSAIKDKLDSTLKSLTGGQDSAALTSAFDLVKGAKLTPQQLDLAKQVGNLASAYAVQKNFTSLEGAQGDVATIVSGVRDMGIEPRPEGDAEESRWRLLEGVTAFLRRVASERPVLLVLAAT